MTDQIAVTGALAMLTPAHRRVIELAYFSGMTQTEIAKELSEPVGTIKTRCRAALGQLRLAMSSAEAEAVA